MKSPPVVELGQRPETFPTWRSGDALLLLRLNLDLIEVRERVSRAHPTQPLDLFSSDARDGLGPYQGFYLEDPSLGLVAFVKYVYGPFLGTRVLVDAKASPSEAFERLRAWLKFSDKEVDWVCPDVSPTSSHEGPLGKKIWGKAKDVWVRVRGEKVAEDAAEAVSEDSSFLSQITAKGIRELIDAIDAALDGDREEIARGLVEAWNFHLKAIGTGLVTSQHKFQNDADLPGLGKVEILSERGPDDVFTLQIGIRKTGTVKFVHSITSRARRGKRFDPAPIIANISFSADTHLRSRMDVLQQDFGWTPMRDFRKH